MFGLGETGEILSVNLNGDITSELNMLRGIQYAREHNQVIRYAENDVDATFAVYDFLQNHIEKVIFNDPATIVYWGDGTKTVVKAKGEAFDPEKGLAMAIAKHHLGNKGNYYNVFNRWLPKGE